MKRPVLCLIFAAVIASAVPLSAMETNFDGKIGGGYAFYPNMPGFDLSADYLWVLDPFFSAGAESGLFWVQWEEKRGKELVGQSNSSLKASTNAFAVPVMGIAQVRLPNLKEKISVLPYLTVGLGYTFMPLTYSDPEYTDSSSVTHKAQNKFYLYHGFTWKVIVGGAFTPAGSNIAFIGETGIVGSTLSHGNSNIGMTRMIVNAGVRFTFGK